MLELRGCRGICLECEGGGCAVGLFRFVAIGIGARFGYKRWGWNARLSPNALLEGARVMGIGCFGRDMSDLSD